ncbi:hypothetical protein RCH18_002488 [Flavobacterium sp. PL11]|uniref:hypothetical protein n=1 Tax=Flavobacterium sp. PL11 TaxID=3071717 RepID=UPI002DFE65B7|nr:hypothetical protein [Flavobacterium sp. PL11]
MLTYTNSDFLKPLFSTLVIKVSSITERFESLHHLTDFNEIHLKTNGVLLVAPELQMLSGQFGTFADEVLIPSGMQLNKDFAFITEKIVTDYNDNIICEVNIEHPDCKEISWLDGMILEDGNYMWYSDPNLTSFEKDANYRLFKSLRLYEPEKFNLNPRIIKIDDTYVHYTVSGLDMHYKLHRDALWYNEKVYGDCKFN